MTARFLGYSGLVLLLLLANAAIGAVTIRPEVLWRWLIGDGISPGAAMVLFEIRLPRLCLAALVGAALAVSGSLLQATFRNPLADPALIGVSSGASLAAASVIVLGMGGVSVPLAACVGATAALAGVFVVAGSAGSFGPGTLLLAGIAIGSVFDAGLGILTFSADDQQLRTLTFWRMGSLGGATWATTAAAAVFILPALILSGLVGRLLDAYQLGDAEAGHVGIDPYRLRLIAIALAAVLAGAAVAVSGTIGFVGLVVPHLVRLAQGPGHRALLPAAGLIGAALVLSADLVARTVLAPAELPIGLVTAAIGAPFFVILLRREVTCSN